MKTTPGIAKKHEWSADILGMSYFGSAGKEFTTIGSSTSGTWLGTEPEWEPDMRDWPASDIIDHHARQLADRRIARDLKAKRKS